MGLRSYGIDDRWKVASDVTPQYSPSLGDAYAVATAIGLDSDEDRDVTLLVGADGDRDVFENRDSVDHTIDRLRNSSA